MCMLHTSLYLLVEQKLSCNLRGNVIVAVGNPLFFACHFTLIICLAFPKIHFSNCRLGKILFTLFFSCYLLPERIAEKAGSFIPAPAFCTNI